MNLIPSIWWCRRCCANSAGITIPPSRGRSSATPAVGGVSESYSSSEEARACPRAASSRVVRSIQVALAFGFLVVRLRLRADVRVLLVLGLLVEEEDEASSSFSEEERSRRWPRRRAFNWVSALLRAFAFFFPTAFFPTASEVDIFVRFSFLALPWVVLALVALLLISVKSMIAPFVCPSSSLSSSSSDVGVRSSRLSSSSSSLPSDEPRLSTKLSSEPSSSSLLLPLSRRSASSALRAAAFLDNAATGRFLRERGRLSFLEEEERGDPPKSTSSSLSLSLSTTIVRRRRLSFPILL
mmetsp:Transcript_18542/g.18762  ORF Transcript_18542/g.18762 Transcript_18542/m.18762 type:complete len:297 (+) Transcript_18542:1599-2489(+)